MSLSQSTVDSEKKSFPLLAAFQNWKTQAQKTGLHPTTLKRNYLIWGGVFVFVILQIPLFIFGPFSADHGITLKLTAFILFCFASSLIVLKRYEDPILGHTLGCFAQFTVLNIGGAGYSYFAAAVAMPLQDDLFMAIDHMMGFDWVTHMEWVIREPYRISVAAFGYSALMPQCQAVVILLVIFRRFHRLQVLLVGWFFAILSTLIVFAAVPAVSVFAHLGIIDQMKTTLPVSGGFSHLSDLLAARAHMPMVIYTSPQGMIPFPSFHACSAAMLIWAFWSIPLLRWPALLINLLMIAATPVIGSHYLVDVFAGVFLAGVALFAANRLLPEPDYKR